MSDTHRTPNPEPRTPAPPPSGARKLVYLTAPGCQVCVDKEPVAEEIAEHLSLPLEKVDTGTSDGAARAESLRIRGVPTLALVQGERVPFRLVGRMITREGVEYLLRGG